MAWRMIRAGMPVVSFRRRIRFGRTGCDAAMRIILLVVVLLHRAAVAKG
jgi:hypothetical protein